MTGGKLRYLLAELAARPDAAVVVEDRYSAVFKLDRVRPAVVADGLAEAPVRFPTVPIVFAETRPLAQEWTYRFLGAAVAHHHDDRRCRAARSPTSAGRAGATAGTDHHGGPGVGSRAGLAVADRGRLAPDVWTAYSQAHPSTVGGD